jgi:hypothetical protein
MHFRNYFFGLVIAICLFSFAGCSGKFIGYGVLLWGIDDPPIPAGTVLAVQLRSNIEQSWITVPPDEYKTAGKEFALVPLPHLEFFSSKRKAEKFAEAFTEYAVTYAETLQDGLSIREKPENTTKQTYRLKEGEIVKILSSAKGVDVISASGNPLDGGWFKVLTQTGRTGYCFSYRLRMFDHNASPVSSAGPQTDAGEDKELELVLSRIWYPESYGTMIDSGRLDLDILSKNYSFTAGISNRRARVHLENGTDEFRYRKITKAGEHTWTFDDTPLKVTLGSNSKLEVVWEDDLNKKRSAIFISLPSSVENIVREEKEKRQSKFLTLYNRGPEYSSSNYGVFTLSANGNFNWDNIDTLPEGMLPAAAVGTGRVDTEYSLAGDMAERYTGAFALRFNAASGSGGVLVFAYTLDNQGLRMEYIPKEYVQSYTISRRAPSPFVIYFNTAN